MDRSLLYVSRKSFLLKDEQTVAQIVADARSRNERVRITGALASTEGHFAQLLEGSKNDLDELMHRIDRDPRHTSVTILRVEAIPQRRIPDWSMAYSGTSHYVARQIAPLIDAMPADNYTRVDRLMSLLIDFANTASDAEIRF